MSNPFETIDARLINLESLTLETLQHLRGRPLTNPATDADELLTPEETATLLKVSKVTVWQWSKPKPGILNPRRIGNQVRYLRSEVMAAARPTKGGATV
jgi:predicted DNA-binding transcriptional regulator AlpA